MNKEKDVSRVSEAETLNIGVDVGGTKIALGLVTSSGVIKAQRRIETKWKAGPELVIAGIICEINELLLQSELDIDKINSIGIGIPGTVDLHTGEVILAPNIDWAHVYLGEKIRAAFPGTSIHVDQDTNAAAYGEFLTCRDGVRNLFFFTVSTGVGSGIVIDGKLYRGHCNIAGEVGHTIVVKDGLLCECGNRGCLQVYGKGPAIAWEAERRIKRGEESVLSISLNSGPLTAFQVAQAALDGDNLARDVILRAAEYIGIALANVVSLLNPDLIIIGGGVARCGDLMLDKIRSVTQLYCYPPASSHVRIQCTKMWEKGGIIGAALLYQTL